VEKTVVGLLRRQLDQQLDKIRAVLVERPPQGWIRSIRNALGMTQAQLAERMSMTPQGVQKIETSEGAYTVRLETLQEVAHALDCRLSYVLVPNQPLQDTVDNQTFKKAKNIVENISHSMSLEDQKTTPEEIDAQIKSVVEDLKKGKKLSVIWDDI
tara:strand:- start:519 stop:986 length:468 start_codon:yes stop_codon:yes gene_type:complete